MEEELSLSGYIIAEEELATANREIDDLLLKLSIGNVTEYSMEENNLDTISNFIDYDISLESDDYSMFKERVSTVLDSLNQIIFARFKSLSPLVNRASEYKLNELNELKRKITSGELIPNPDISKSKMDVLNKKLAVFYSSGYNVENNCSQLIDYMNHIVMLTNRSGKYLMGLQDMYDKLNAEGEQNIPKLSGLLNVKNSLGGLVSTVNRKYNITDFRLSIVNNWFTSRAELFMITYSSRKGRGIKTTTEMYDVSLHRDIKKSNNSDTLRLIDYGIKHQGKLVNIHKSLSFAVKVFVRDNTMQLIKSASGTNNVHRFLVARYSEGVIKSLINLYRNTMSYDSIIIAYVNATYKQATANDKKVTIDKNKIVVDTTKHN
jgi:hypothetical protein